MQLPSETRSPLPFSCLRSFRWRILPSRLPLTCRCIAVLLVVAMSLALWGCAGTPAAVVPSLEDAQGIVYNASQGIWLGSVEEAFSGAQDGDLLYLYEDAESGALSTGASDVRLDLQGFTLRIDSTGSGARGGQGLAHDALALGSGECSIADGSIVARVGAQPETVQSAASAYRGITSAEGGKLVLDGVQVDVTYVGSSTIAPVVELDGVATAGSLDLFGGTSVSVTAAPAEGLFGASTATGVRLDGVAADVVVSVSGDSSILVRNNAAQVAEGAVGYPDVVMGTTKESNAELTEIALDEDLDWYDDLLGRFLVNAQFDDQADENGYVYGSEVYYASALSLENGLMVWAYSDPVSVADAGTLKGVKPAHVFVRSDYVVPLDAYGIQCGEGFSGTVEQAGTVNVSTTLGHAVGVYEAPTGTFELDEESIAPSCGQDSYRASAGAFNLADFIDLNVPSDTMVVYPRQSTYTSVRQERPSAWKSATLGSEVWQYATQPILFDELFEEWDEHVVVSQGEEDEETTVGLSLVYYRVGQDGGYLYTGEEAGTYVYSPDLDLAPVANERVAPGDVVEIGGVQNRFLGWSTRMSDEEPLFTDSIVVPDGNWGSFGAKLVLYGLYETVQEPSDGQAQGQVPSPVAADAEVGGQEATQATQATQAASGSLPSGGLDAGVVQEQEPFSPLGGAVVLGAMALFVAAACLTWFARGRKVRAGAIGAFGAADAKQDEAQDASHGSPEQERKGGLVF